MNNNLSPWQEYTIDVLGLSVRPYNALRRAEVHTLGQLIVRVKFGDLHEIRNFGVKSTNEVEEKFRTYLGSLGDVDIEAVFQPEQEIISLDTSRETTLPLPQPVLHPVWHLHSITKLGLSPRLYRLLQKSGCITLETVALLAEKTNPRDAGIIGFGIKQLEYLKASLKVYLASLPESAFKLVNPAYGSATTPSNEANLNGNEDLRGLSLQEEIQVWLTSLYKERERDIIKWRYGLEQESLTLEEIGQKLGITRERIRQIEHRALLRLTQSIECKTILEQIMVYLRAAFDNAGGILTDDEIIAVATDFVPKDISESGLLNLLARISGKFKYDSQVEVWTWGKLPITAIHRQIKKILRSTPLMSDTVLLTQLQKTYPNLEISFLQACLRTHPDIEQTEDGRVTFKKWARRRTGIIIQALRQIGRPAHFTEITEIVNQLLPPEAQVEPHNIHAQIQRLANTFVWVERGTYGLAEWGLERSEFYPDIVEHVLRESEHPLTIQETLTRVCEIRDCKESTVLMLLTLNPRFRVFPGNVYGLAEWRDEDFLDDAYREKRLLASITEDELLNRRKPKQNVAQTLQDIDDLLGAARTQNHVVELPLFYRRKE